MSGLCFHSPTGAPHRASVAGPVPAAPSSDLSSPASLRPVGGAVSPAPGDRPGVLLSARRRQNTGPALPLSRDGEWWPVGLLIVLLPWLVGLWLGLLAPHPSVDWDQFGPYRAPIGLEAPR